MIGQFKILRKTDTSKWVLDLCDVMSRNAPRSAQYRKSSHKERGYTPVWADGLLSASSREGRPVRMIVVKRCR